MSWIFNPTSLHIRFIKQIPDCADYTGSLYAGHYEIASFINSTKSDAMSIIVRDEKKYPQVVDYAKQKYNHIVDPVSKYREFRWVEALIVDLLLGEKPQ